MILKCNNEKVRNLVRYAETLSFTENVRLGVNILESNYISVKYDRILGWLKQVLSLFDKEYEKTQFIAFLNYKHFSTSNGTN